MKLKTMKILKSAVIGGAISLFVLAPAAEAAPVVPWKSVTTVGKASGGFVLSDGGSDKGLFGDPTVIGNNILFTPANFQATASNGSATTTSDRLQFNVTSTNGDDIDAIRFQEFGDYSILGGGSVSAVAGLFLFDGQGNVYTDGLGFTPTFPVSTATSAGGLYSGSSVIDLPAGVKMVQVVFNNILQAAANPGGTASIQKKLVRGGVDIQIIVPEPSSLAVLFGGTGLLALRRRRA